VYGDRYPCSSWFLYVIPGVIPAVRQVTVRATDMGHRGGRRVVTGEWRVVTGHRSGEWVSGVW